MRKIRRGSITGKGGKGTLVNRRTVKSLAILTLLIWVGIVVLGRLIAYDYVWGSWSLKPKG